MIVKLAPAFRRWTDRAKNVALLGAIAAGCVYGYAYAIAPTVDTGREFVGSVNIATTVGTGSNPIYTVPAGRQFTMTDIIIGNDTSSTPSIVILATDDATCTGGFASRLNNAQVPASDTLHLALVTGFGFGPGKTVCAFSQVATSWTVRGYLTNDT